MSSQYLILKMSCHLAIIFSLMTIASGYKDLAITKISYAKDGQPCLNDCINGKCYTDNNFVEKSCISGEEMAPTYFTSQTQDKATCLSRCARYGYSYEWCFVANDESWDYCNSEVQTKWVHNQHQTVDFNDHCVDSCNLDGNAYMCTDYQGSRQKCNPKPYKFIQINSVYGEKCMGMYHKHNTPYYKYYFCKISSGDVRYAAPPAKAPPINEFCKDLASTGCVLKKGLRKSRCIFNANSKMSTVLKVADAIENSNYFPTVTLNQHRNPIYKYTMKPPQDYGYPELPLVLRAKVTADTVRSTEKPPKLSLQGIENLKLMAEIPKEDKPRYLIGYLIGGTDNTHNIVPLRQSVRLRLRELDNEIFTWVQVENTSADITVVVMYKNHSRPDALGVDIVFKKDGEIVKTNRDLILQNIEPGEEVKIKEPQRNRISVTPQYRVKDDIEVDYGLF